MDPVSLGPLAPFLPLGLLASGMVATARQWFPKIDGLWTILACFVASCAVSLVADFGKVPPAQLAVNALATSVVAVLVFNFVKAAMSKALPLVALALFASASLACTPGARMQAIEATTFAAEMADEARPVLNDKCVLELPGLPEAEKKTRVEICDHAIPTYDAVIVAIIATKAILLGASEDLPGLMRQVAKLATLVPQLAADLEKLIVK